MSLIIFESRTLISMIVASWFLISMFYYNIFNLIGTYEFIDHIYKSMQKIPIYTPSYNGTEDFLINTPGCYIPNYLKTLQYIEVGNIKSSCGLRAVFIKKVSDDKIIFYIDDVKMKTYQSGKRKMNCCYRFVTRSKDHEKEDSVLTYSQCVLFQNGTIVKLEQEIISVTCRPHSFKRSSTVYEDAYIILKKINIKNNKKSIENRWNVLLLGMDTMSRGRVFNSMPQTIHYLQKHDWLDYRGYQKVGFNTFPNLMAVLTGKKMSTISKECVKDMDNCNKIMIWSKFKEASFVTAYGEDFLRLPDTFSKHRSFKIPPTDHYMRSFFLTGETRSGNLVCTKKIPSGEHLLDYAYQFINTYKKENFFGMFWLNSYSHNLDNLPLLIDNKLIDFFRKLNNTGLFSNTFIVFLSDHGTRYGKMRLPMESYYDERLPMFFIWTPLQFIQMFSQKYYNLQVNQNRLTTPYDLHVTLWDILKLSQKSTTVQRAEACPNCETLFEEKSPHRTCDDARVDEKWCSCHNMIKIDHNKPDINHSTNLVISFIQNKLKTIKTKPCTACETLKLETVLRSHSYRDTANNKTYFVVAILMSPGDVAYEATVRKIDEKFNIIEPFSTISRYNIINCVKNRYDREYCVCKKIAQCKKNIYETKN